MLQALMITAGTFIKDARMLTVVATRLVVRVDLP